MARGKTLNSSTPRQALAGFLLLAALAAPGPAAIKKMFLSSVSGTSKLSTWPEAQAQGGLDAGDAICRTLAQNASLPNFSLYRAWLSTTSEDAYCRVAGFSGKLAANCGQATLPEAGPWQLVNGAPFARSLAELTGDLAVLHPPIVTESGATFWGATYVHTGTSADGTTFANGNCSGWVALSGSERVGGLYNTGVSWTSSANLTCGGFFARLYCFEPGAGDPLPEFERPGALVFATSASGQGNLGAWVDAGPATGIAAGDAICRARALSAGLPSPQSFVAWLSDDGVDAIDRVTTNGPFKRLDGVEISASRAGLVDPGLGQYALDTTVSVDENATYLGVKVWTGSTTLGERAIENCANWTSALALDDARPGYMEEIRGFWTTSNSVVTCDVPRHLYCFSNVITIFWDGFESGDRTRWSASVP
ncbi:MAG: hypothetical protein ABI689_03125 [Thermoanaerobaculia bacterium]